MIPVRNLYAMLAYAAFDAGQLDSRAIGACDFERPYDVLARLLDATMRRLRQQGIDRRFQEIPETGTRPRGAIDLSRSVAMLLPPRGQLAWTVDELIADTAANRLLKCALRVLLRQPALDVELLKRLRAHAQWLGGVRDVDARAALRAPVRTPAGMPAYGQGIQLSRLVLQDLLPDEGGAGDDWYAQLHRPERMQDLYERFVRGFAAFEFASRARVSARSLGWGEQDAGALGVELLPRMRTDVFIDWVEGSPTIVECKYYQDPLSQSQFSEWGRLRSGHIYQLLAYLRAAERTLGRQGRGLLLYAESEEPLQAEVALEGYGVRAETISLADDWPVLHGRLLEALQRT